MSRKRTGVQAPPAGNAAGGIPIVRVDEQSKPKNRLTKLERLARKEVQQSIRVASFGGMSSIGSGNGSIRDADSAFYSPQLSTDFLELPQSEREKREYFRFWYRSHAIVGSAIDFHTDVPMSKIRLSMPKGKDPKKNKEILRFFERMCKRLRMFQALRDATHEYWLQGVCFIFAEDHDMTEEIPKDLIAEESEEQVQEVDFAGRPRTKTQKTVTLKPDHERDKSIRDYVKEHYRGWERLRILPPEQIKVEVFQYTNRVKMELVPSEKDRMLVQKAQTSEDPDFAAMADEIPSEIRDHLESGKPIPLNTSPYDSFLCSSFCHYLARRSAYDDRGTSLLERCLRTLVYQDKLRQAQTSIASRAMTPKRVVWAEKMSQEDVDDLRDQIDQALIDPDYTIISNFEIHWDEIGARDRLLDLSSEYEITNKLLYIGLRITESMLTGESSYSGERIHLDVMNTMYLLYRETLAEFVEQQLFEPVAEKKGFYEDDEFGNRTYIYPKLQFTRLALRDNTELQDFMYNLYTKGSLPISYILDLLNIDSDEALEQLKTDMFTPNDSNFNEFIRAVMAKAGDAAVEETDVLDRISKNVNLKPKKKGDRFAGKED